MKEEIDNKMYQEINKEQIEKDLEKLAEKFIKDKDTDIEDDYYISFIIARFILLKELIIKKNSTDTSITFDINKNMAYIKPIFKIYEIVQGKYIMPEEQDKIKIIGEIPKEIDTSKLKEAIWAISKMRDFFVHDKIKYNKILQILKIEEKIDGKAINKNISYEMPLEVLKEFCFLEFNNKYLKGREKLVDAISENLTRYVLSDALEHYINKLSEDAKTIIKNALTESLSKEEDTNKPSFEEINFLNYKNLENIFKNSNLKKKLKIINTIIKSSYSLDIEKMNFDSELQVEIIDYIFWRFKSSYEIISNSKASIRQQSLLEEIDLLLTSKNKSFPEEFNIILYLYSFMVLSNLEQVKYQYLKVKDLNMNLTGDYECDINNIVKQCQKYNRTVDVMETAADVVNDSEKQKNIYKKVFNQTINFIEEVMPYFYRKNERIVKSLRNALAHGNFKKLDDENILLIDKNNQSDDSTIKFNCVVNAETLFNFTKSVHQPDLNKKYNMSSFLDELSNVIDKDLFEKTKINMLKSFERLGIKPNLNEELDTFVEKQNIKVLKNKSSK